MADRYRIMAGTVQGREHRRLRRNNQDGIGITVEPELVAAVVTDGCSEGAASEVGATLAAQWLAAWAPRYVKATHGRPARYVPALARGLVRYLAPMARGLSAQPGIDPAVVQSYFLFTFLMAIVTPKELVLFGLGDGLYAIDGRVTQLDPGPDNAPDYLGYRLLDENPRVSPALHLMRSSDFDSLIIATDGAAELDLDELAHHPRYLKNRSLLHKRLGQQADRLFDDTTAVMIRRRP